jgi:hypothetical protein
MRGNLYTRTHVSEIGSISFFRWNGYKEIPKMGYKNGSPTYGHKELEFIHIVFT